MKASEVFLHGEGDHWFQRAQNGNIARRVAYAENWMRRVWERFPYAPEDVLEIGCSDGLHLDVISSLYPHPEAVSLHGIDPSAGAVASGLKRNPALQLTQGTADCLPYGAGQFDCVMFGFCLCWCDPDSLFRIAAEADRVLRDRGFLIVYDFDTPFSYKNVYAHHQGMHTHKMQYSKMFSWHPAYSLMEVMSLSLEGYTFHPHPNERISISLLYKDNSGPALVNPYG